MNKKRIKQLIITLILFVVSIVLFIVSKNNVDNQDIVYEEVKVTVIRAETEKLSSGARNGMHFSYHVTVFYEGENYELINVQSGEMPKYEGLANLEADLQNDNPYFDNTVYLSNGKLYSNIAGIKTDTKQFNWQMLGLAGIAIFGTLHLMCVVDLADKKKKLKQENQ